MNASDTWKTLAQELDWERARRALTTERFRPMYDRAFSRLHREIAGQEFIHDAALKTQFIADVHHWLHGGSLNRLRGLDGFAHRDFILGVTHALDDLHVAFGERVVVLEKEYLYHRRMKPQLVPRRLETLRKGDVLVLGIPFAYYGDLHPDTDAILQRCLELSIPVHVDAAWMGCLRGFEFNYDHPAIHSVAFSLSKGLGLGSHRAGVRYTRVRHLGPVTIINDFSMEVVPVMSCGVRFMREFGSDYIQNRYGAAYELVCQRLNLRPTKAIHIAFADAVPVGVRAILRYLVDEVDELAGV